MTERLFLSPDDLDEMLKLFQSLLEQTPTEETYEKISFTERRLAVKYQNYHLNESDRKLLNRFLSRLYDLIEISKQKMSQEVRQKFMETIRQFNETKQLQFQNFFSAVVPKKPVIEPSSCRALNQNSYSCERESPKKVLPSWYEISLANKPLYNFYSSLFWKIYDNEILQLDKQHIQTLYVLYQTREQNYDRLYRDIKNRNSQISQSLQWVKHHQTAEINFEQRAKSLSCYLDTKLNHTCTVDFGQKATAFFNLPQRKPRAYSQIQSAIVKKKTLGLKHNSPIQSQNVYDDDPDIQIEPAHAHAVGPLETSRKSDFRGGGRTSIILLEKNPLCQANNDNGNFSPQKNRKYRRQSLVKQALIMQKTSYYQGNRNFPEIKQPQSVQNTSLRSRKVCNENGSGAQATNNIFNLRQLVQKKQSFSQENQNQSSQNYCNTTLLHSNLLNNTPLVSFGQKHVPWNIKPYITKIEQGNLAKLK